MNSSKEQQHFSIVRVFKKLFLSAFVVVTFIAYALNNKSGSSQAVGNSGLVVTGGNGSNPQNTQVIPPTATAANPIAAPAMPTAVPSETPAAPEQPTSTAVSPTQTPSQNTAPKQAQNSGQYKNGSYTGPEVDAWYGLVRVQVTIQNGQIASVQVPEYPSDRRTSQRINSFAVPALTQEAVQAQSANVDLISGATLTSQAFQQSLQLALNDARIQ